MDGARRTLLKTAAAVSTLAVGAGAGLLKPVQAFAADWNKSGFDSKAMADALKSIDATSSEESKDILIKAPEIAENGAVVPVEVTSNIPNTKYIAILAEKNPFPLIASFDLENGAQGYVSTRVKMGQTSNVKVIVKADGKTYSATKEVKVTIGGCGG